MIRLRALLGIFFPLALCALPAWAGNNPYIRSCGDYDVVGKVHCGLDACFLTVYPESQGEIVLRIETSDSASRLDGYRYFESAFVHAAIRVRNKAFPAKALALDDLPERSVPDFTRQAFQLRRRLNCEN